MPSTSAAAGARLEASGGRRILDTFAPGRVRCRSIPPTGPRGPRPGYRIERAPAGEWTLEGPSQTQVGLDFFVDSGTTTLTPRVQLEWHWRGDYFDDTAERSLYAACSQLEQHWRGDYFDSYADNPRPSLPPSQRDGIRAELSQDRRRAVVTFVSFSESGDVNQVAWYRSSITVVCPQPMPAVTL